MSERKDHEAHRVPLGYQDLQEHKAIQDLKAFLETRVIRERQDVMAPGAPRGNGEKWGCPVFLV